MKKLIILKIGGSCLTYKKEQIPSIREGFLERLSNEILESAVCEQYSLIIIHGGGSVTHPLLNKYNVSDKLKIGHIASKDDKIFSSRIHLAMNKLNTEITEKLLDYNIPAWQFQTSAAFTSSKRFIDTSYTDAVRSALYQGFIPILHGDLNIDTENGVSICSGDMLACFLAKKLGAKKIFFASNVDGVYENVRHMESGELPLKTVDISIAIPEDIINKDVIDHSGGMIGKLNYVRMYCDESEVYIFNGLIDNNFKKILCSEEVGSRILY